MCLNLIKGYRSRENRQKVFTIRKGYYDLPATVPCGQCIECRLKHSREKAIQCTHEASLYSSNTVVTLTYADEYLPAGGSLQPEHATNFMKRVRAMEDYKAEKTGGTPPAIKSFGCGEYGEKHGRPHYHIILFNYDFEDKIEHNPGNCKVCQTSRDVCPGPGYYGSDILTEKWGKGRCELMDLTFESAAYVARYVLKKLKGAEHTRIRWDGNQFQPIADEQPVCATQKGIGKEWYKEWKKEIYKSDLVYRSKRTGERIPMTPPKYYDRRYEIENPNDWKKTKRNRRKKQKKYLDKIEKEIQAGNTTNAFNQGIGDRDMAKKIVAEATIKELKRGLEI